jgi:hypothetical protein
LSFIYREKAQNDENGILYTILRENNFYGLDPSGYIISYGYVAMVTWDFFERMAAIENFPKEVFLAQAKVNECFK